MFFFLLVAAAVAVAAAAAAGGPVRVAADPVRVGSGDAIVVQSRAIDAAAAWSCGRGKKIPIPQPSDVLPKEIVAMGGPIVQAIDTMIGAVKTIFAKLGWARRCTVRGGEFVVLALIDRVSGDPPSIRVVVQVGYPADDAGVADYGGHHVAATWEFVATSNDSVEFPLPVESVGPDAPADEAAHLLDGRKPPPDHVWPHGNMLKWQQYGPDSYVRRPSVYLIRSGDTLSLAIWLPPRAPLQHVNKWGTDEILDALPRWIVTWQVKR